MLLPLILIECPYELRCEREMSLLQGGGIAKYSLSATFLYT